MTKLTTLAMKKLLLSFGITMALCSSLVSCTSPTDPLETLPPQCQVISAADLKELSTNFLTPGDENRAWVYWFIMDGNLSKEGITADLEAMARVGIGGAIFLEVNVGVPRGTVEFMSPEWVKLFSFASSEAERLGIELTLISGPGWTGSGGPWVKPEDAMHFIVADTASVSGGSSVSIQLPKPTSLKPYFGFQNLTPKMQAENEAYYEDLFVLAYPRVSPSAPLALVDEKALYVRHPYTSAPDTKPFVEMPAMLEEATPGTVLALDQCIDLTGKMDSTGLLTWEAPAGEWIIYRFARRLTGANTRPAPLAAVGYECSKLDTAAFNRHFDYFIGTLIEAAGKKPHNQHTGWNMLHIDSWEMGPQNWSNDFRAQFQARRGYDLQPYLPTISGQIVDSREVTERFLWDLRNTASEVMLDNHARHLKRIAHRYGFGLSIEPYDMHPGNDIALGGIADVPMCETWEQDDIFNSSFSCPEAVSAAHINNRPIVGSEAFTGHDSKSWRMHPGNMKNQTDWAFCIGINRLVFHRYAHQPWLDRAPGMTMGSIGMHYERTQTWWELSQAWHTYLSRCQYILRQGQGVADLLLLTPEGAPHAFDGPTSAFLGGEKLPYKRGHNFDGCDPATLMTKAYVKQGNICFPGGMEYRLLVLPTTQRMTPQLLLKIEELVEAGASVLGFAPLKSPSLTNYPSCDQTLSEITSRMWSGATPGGEKTLGRGHLYVPTAADTSNLAPSVRGFIPPYVSYEAMAGVLKKMNVSPDFESSTPLRYIHRTSNGMEIYMVSNPTAESVNAACTFRVADKAASLWCAVQGAIAPATTTATADGRTALTLPLEPYGSAFVIFANESPDSITTTSTLWPNLQTAQEISGPWSVTFQERRGAPEGPVSFTSLTDWSQNREDGIKYFSGIAQYTNTFTLPAEELAAHKHWHLDLGQVEVMARVKINGQTVNELWKFPYRCEVTSYLVPGENRVEISVANQWPNRMTGDLFLPVEKRITFSTFNNFTKDFKLLPSGLMGPVQLCWSE